MATASFVHHSPEGDVPQLKFHGRLIIGRCAGTVALLEDEYTSMHPGVAPITDKELWSGHDDPLLDECLW